MDRNNSHWQAWWTLIAAGISSLLVTTDFTIVNVSLASIQKDLLANFSELQWIVAGFGLTFCTFLTTMGRLSDTLGRRKLLYIGVITFGIASLGAGLSQIPWQLILCRLLQGVGGAVIFPSGMALTAAAFPEERRGRALGIYGSFMGMGVAIGPVLGGFILHIASWRWIFFINIPAIIISLLLCFLVVKESHTTDAKPIDWQGTFFLTCCLASLITAMTEGPLIGWLSTLEIFYFSLALISFIFFLNVEHKAADPLLDFSLFKNKGFIIGTLTFIAAVGFAWPIIFFIPLYLQNVLNFSPLTTGLVLLPMTLMTVFAPSLAGHLYDRYGTRLVVLLVFLTVLISYVLQFFLTAFSSLYYIILTFFLFGYAWGTANGVGTPIVLSKLKNMEEAGVVSGVSITLLNIAGVVALACTGAIFQHIEKNYLFTHLPQENIFLSSTQTHLVRSYLSDPVQLEQMLIAQFNAQQISKINMVFHEGFLQGFHVVIVILSIITLMMLIKIIPLLGKDIRTSTNIHADQ